MSAQLLYAIALEAGYQRAIVPLDPPAEPLVNEEWRRAWYFVYHANRYGLGGG